MTLCCTAGNSRIWSDDKLKIRSEGLGSRLKRQRERERERGREREKERKKITE